MVEPLKNHFGPEIAEQIAVMVSAVHPSFDSSAFITFSADGFADLELTPRARHLADGLALFLPDNPERAVRILTASLDCYVEPQPLTAMSGFVFLPHVYFVATYGLDCFEASMDAQYEVTQRFTAEFSIRAFIERYEAATLERLRVWASDSSVHVRRLVSEGTRPRLPWAPRLAAFQVDPGPVVELLELLKDDEEEYVRRSVANNLNDIAKDHPELVVDVCRSWWTDGNRDRRRLIRHGLRTLVKQGDAGALGVLGYEASSPVEVNAFTVAPDAAEIGSKVVIEVEIVNPSAVDAAVLVDLRVHFQKSNGSTSPKVFKGAELTVAPDGSAIVRKSISLAQHSTRTHYPGDHQVDVMVNGVSHPGGMFSLS